MSVETFILMSEGTSTTEEGADVPTLFIHLSTSLSEIFAEKKTEILNISNAIWDEYFPEVAKWRWQPRIEAYNGRTVIKTVINDLEENQFETMTISKFKNRGPKTRRIRKQTVMAEKYEQAEQILQGQ